MKKTALQQAIEEMNRRLKYSETPIVTATMSRCISICEQLLPTEREQIKDALFDGYWLSTDNALSIEDIERGFPEYYEKTYGE